VWNDEYDIDLSDDFEEVEEKESPKIASGSQYLNSQFAGH